MAHLAAHRDLAAEVEDSPRRDEPNYPKVREGGLGEAGSAGDQGQSLTIADLEAQ